MGLEEAGADAGQRFKYRAFISYRHKDKAWADWLHRSLETYRVPRELVGQAGRDGAVPARITPVFRDREELAASVDLGQEIQAALSASATLIVICTPGAVASRYVAEEILSFKRLGRADRIFAIICEGEPHAADPALECFPEPLKFQLGSDGSLSNVPAEPIAADAREQGDGKENAKLKLIAGVLGVGFDQLRRRELEAQKRRFRRFAAIAATLVLIFAGLAGAAGWFGYQSQIERRRAEDNLAKARGTANAVVADLAKEFRDAAGMQAVLGQRILARAKALMDDLSGQGGMTERLLRERAEALGLLGRVTLDIGQAGGAEPALREALRTWSAILALQPDDAGALLQAARAETSLAWAASSQGHAEKAESFSGSARNRVERLLALPSSGGHPALRAEALDLAVSLDEAPASDTKLARIQEAIALRRTLAADDASGEEARRLAASYRALASVQIERGDLEAAGDADRQSLATIEALVARDDYVARWQGDLAAHLMGSAVVAFRRGDPEATKSVSERALHVAERLILLDPTNARYRELAAQAAGILNALANMMGDLGAQEATQTKAVTIWQGLVDVDPRNLEAKANLAGAWANLANFHAGQGHVDARIEASRQVVALRDAIAAVAPGREAEIALAEALVTLAFAVQVTPEGGTEALALVDRAAGLIAPYLAATPEDEGLVAIQTQIDVVRTMAAAAARVGR